MATQVTPLVPFGEPDNAANVAVQRPWRMRGLLSSLADGIEHFLARAGPDRGPWLAIAFAAGIGSWFAFNSPWQWMGVAGLALLTAISVRSFWHLREDRAATRLALIVLGMTFALGIAVAWARSEVVGAEPLARPSIMQINGRVLEREEQPAEGRVRLVLAARDAEAGRAIRLRVNVPRDKDIAEATEGAQVRLRARLMPPSPPLLPGAYDFARAAWFEGYAATGSLVGDIELVEGGKADKSGIAGLQRFLSAHVRSQLDGSAGSIAAAFASGDRGAIAEADEIAMRDAGLTHLLSISGLHVSAVIAAAYFLALKVLALWPWLTLRIRLPLLAAAIGAGAGIGYTLLTGAEVPTVRSCVGAVLVLIALALGREPLSMRMVATAAGFVLLLWPESLVGPSFQMSFCAVIAIVALHNAQPIREFLRPRDESWLRWFARRVLMLFVAGIVIEIALTPIVLFHFHRAGLYGAFANVLAIPLVTFVSMPLIALGLLFDIAGLGMPFWWLAGQSLDLLLFIANTTASQPGAVKLVPQMSMGTVLLFVAGGLWLALWRGRARLFGFVPAMVGTVLLTATPVPDLLVTRDGIDVGIVDRTGRLFLLRDSPGSYSQENIVELSGAEAAPLAIVNYPGARCSADFCSVMLNREGRAWHLLIARSREQIDERALASACELSDLVIADRWLPRSCKPRWLKADRRYLAENGGLAIYLSRERIDTVAESQGEHGWWRGDNGQNR